MYSQTKYEDDSFLLKKNAVKQLLLWRCAAERHFKSPLDRTKGLRNENILDFFSFTAKVKITFS